MGSRKRAGTDGALPSLPAAIALSRLLSGLLEREHPDGRRWTQADIANGLSMPERDFLTYQAQISDLILLKDPSLKLLNWPRIIKLADMLGWTPQALVAVLAAEQEPTAAPAPQPEQGELLAIARRLIELLSTDQRQND